MSIATEAIQRAINQFRASGYADGTLAQRSCLNVLVEMKCIVEHEERKAAKSPKSDLIERLTTRINAAGEVTIQEHRGGVDVPNPACPEVAIDRQYTGHDTITIELTPPSRARQQAPCARRFTFGPASLICSTCQRPCSEHGTPYARKESRAVPVGSPMFTRDWSRVQTFPFEIQQMELSEEERNRQTEMRKWLDDQVYRSMGRSQEQRGMRAGLGLANDLGPEDTPIGIPLEPVDPENGLYSYDTPASEMCGSIVSVPAKAIEIRAGVAWLKTPWSNLGSGSPAPVPALALAEEAGRAAQDKCPDCYEGLSGQIEPCERHRTA